MSRKKRIVLLDGADSRVFPSIDDAARFCGGRHCNLLKALKAGRKYKGLSFVFEGSDVVPKCSQRGRHSNRPRSRKVSEFRDGELYKVYPSVMAAAREMRVEHRYMWHILNGDRKNHTGKDFDFASPLDECLVEIRERNKQPYK